MKTTELRYIPGIQGLRAIAVLLVLAAHAGAPHLHGGLVGVDMFFVISGYLITGLLVTELESQGKLGLAQFYARRLKRLLPALLFMLGVTSLAIAAFAPLHEHPAQASSAASAALWVSNIYFILTEQSYFESTSLANAFLHTWSLGVEEQFYLLWPLLILLIYKTTASLRLAVLLFIASASFILCIWLAQKSPTLAFYLMPSRIWQFSAGAIVWLLASRPTVRAQLPTNALLLPGLLAIFGAAFWIDETTRYPDWISLLPTLGTAACLMVLGRQPESKAANTLLGRGPLKYVGDISYSLYLWHWPVLVIGQHLIPENTLYSQVLLVAASFLLAHISYRIVENPIRSYKSARLLPKWQVVASLALIALTNVQLIKWHNSATDQIAAQQQTPFALARGDIPEIYRLGCDDWYTSSQVKACKFGANEAPKLAVIWGDSIGLQWFPALKKALALESGQWRIIVITKSACPIVNLPLFYDRLGRIYTECAEWRSAAAAYIKRLKADLLIIGSAGSYGFSQADWEEGTLSILQEYASTSEKTALIAPTYSLGFNGVSCLEAGVGASQGAVGDVDCTTSTENQKQSLAIAGLRNATQEVPNTTLIDLNDLVCPDDTCQAYMNDRFVYRDNQHITATFATSLSSAIQKRLGLAPSRPSLSTGATRHPTSHEQ